MTTEQRTLIVEELHALLAQETPAEAALAIQDVGRWWPQDDPR